MPVYEYECEKCRLRFEVRRHFGEDGGSSCPECRWEARRLFTPVPIIFKGSGFYVTDSKNDHSHPQGKLAERYRNTSGLGTTNLWRWKYEGCKDRIE